jgi:16S rRNA (cytosine1402-N4)-methyltransferase
MNDDYQHQTVLLHEAVDLLITEPAGHYVDATFGRGGHSRLILDQLSKTGQLLAFDKDPQAVAAAVAWESDSRFTIKHQSFASLVSVLQQRRWHGKVAGILLDLGVSSPQLDNPERGFSFTQDGPLDMRMNSQIGLSAADWLAQAREAEIADALYHYGEERYARRMARAIVAARQYQPITRTAQLAAIVAAANPRWEQGKNPATRAFQGIRIQINGELDELQLVLEQALEGLRVGGRLVVISFHSLEDRLVKRFMRTHVKGDQNLPAGLPFTERELCRRLRLVGKKYRASAAEVAHNPRARSAVMRVAEKIA